MWASGAGDRNNNGKENKLIIPKSDPSLACERYIPPCLKHLRNRKQLSQQSTGKALLERYHASITFHLERKRLAEKDLKEMYVKKNVWYSVNSIHRCAKFSFDRPVRWYKLHR